MMLVRWVSDDEDLHQADRSLGTAYAVHLQVESLGVSGWDWHVWERSGQGRQWYGLADSVVEAKGAAENALRALAWGFGREAWVLLVRLPQP